MFLESQGPLGLLLAEPPPSVAWRRPEHSLVTARLALEAREASHETARLLALGSWLGLVSTVPELLRQVKTVPRSLAPPRMAPGIGPLLRISASGKSAPLGFSQS